MTTQEKLQENYENALFALMMNEFAKAEGAHLLEENERLKENPEFEVPQAIHQRSLKTIRRELSKKHRQAARKPLKRTIARFILTAAVITALFTTAFATSSEFRAGTLNLLIKLNEKAETWQFSSDISGTNNSTLDITPTGIPDGYYLVSATQSSIQTSFKYENEIGSIIQIRVFEDPNMSFGFDVEDTDHYKDTVIQDCPAVIVVKNGLVKILWADNELGVFVSVEATDLDVDSAVTVAENVVIEK
jgi:hypothetical protein